MNYKTLAINLAKKYSNESEIPAKYKNQKARKEKDSKILLKFEEDVYHWDHVLERLFLKFNSEQVFRFIDCRPIIDECVKHPIECSDFIDLHEYLILRRDIENCDDQELGRLAMLLGSIQEKIENALSPGEAKKEITLKNERAQELMQQKVIYKDGLELNLWSGHSFDSVKGQMTWNKIRSFAELNENSTGENGSLVITGILQIPRKEAAELASSFGFKVHSNVSHKTDYLVVGSANVSPTEIARMEQFNTEGSNIRLIGEIEFLSMLSEHMN